MHRIKTLPPILIFCLALCLCNAGCSMGDSARKPAESPFPKDVKSLVGKLGSADTAERDAALKEIRALGKTAVPELIQMLDDTNAATRRNSATALGEIGPPHADEAMEKLKDLAANDPDASVRKAASDAVKQIEARF